MDNLYSYIPTYPETIKRRELIELTGHCDRVARELVEQMAYENPICFSSRRSGYCKPSTAAEARHTKAEILSRVDKLLKRLKPLDEFIQQIEGQTAI